MKKLLGITMAAAVAFSSAAAMAKDDGKIIVNGTDINAACIENTDGETMIPLRAVCESLGFKVEWDEATRMISLVNLPMYITCSPDSDGYTFAKTAPLMLGTEPKLVDGRTYVPTAFISEIMQGSIEEGEELKIDVTVPQKTTVASAYITEREGNTLTVMDAERGAVIVNVDDTTEIVDSEGKPLEISAIDTSKQLTIVYGEAMTMSLPPITNAVRIEVTEQNAQIADEN